MKTIRLGKTEITVPQNGFGCLPIQRDSTEVAVRLLREAYAGGMLHRHEDGRQNAGCLLERPADLPDQSAHRLY